MGWQSATAVGPAVCGPGYEYFLLAARVRRCAQDLETIIDRLHAVEQLHWQSPAGAGLRVALSGQRHTLHQLVRDFGPAEYAITRLGETAAAEQLAQLAWAPP